MKKMIRCISFCWLFFLSMLASALPDAAGTRLNQLLHSFTTYEANFTQETRLPNSRLMQKGSGLVKIKRPGKFLWVTTKPAAQRLITDGKTLWIYDVDLAQATRQSLASRVSIDPATLLSGGENHLTDSFTIRQGKEGDHFILFPKKNNVGFEKIEMTFVKNQLVQMIVVNSLSQTSQFDFSAIKLNQVMPDCLFQFKPPAGVDVISQ